MLVFATLTEELNELAGSASKFINSLLLYREECIVSANEPATASSEVQVNGTTSDYEEDEYSATATILPVLFDMICYLRRCYEVGTNLMLQKHSMLAYASTRTNDKNFQSSLREILPDLNSNIRYLFALVVIFIVNLVLFKIRCCLVFSSQSGCFLDQLGSSFCLSVQHSSQRYFQL